MTRLAAAAALCSGLVAAQELPQFVARVDLVRVDVLATHRGRPIPGLTARDFRLLDNGVPQTLNSVLMEEVPLSVILAFDASTSMAGEPVQHLTEAGVTLVDRLGQQDRAALLTFSEELVLASPLTSDLDGVRTALAQISAGGATSLFDAIHAGLTLRDLQPDRTVLLVFTDGLDNTSWLSGPDVLERARASDVVVYGVTLADERGRSRRAPAWPGDGPLASPPVTRSPHAPDAHDDHAFLRHLARETGGQVIAVASTRRLPQVFGRILDELKTRYVLTYYPEGVERTGWHELDVSLAGRPGEVVARRGYYAGRQ